MASSLPPPPTESVAPTPDRFAEAMSRADGCPECVVNYQTPCCVELMDAGFAARYWCDACDYGWTTTWSDR